MHYKNGREAKNGDKVVLVPSYGNPVVGVLYDAVAGNDHCNGKLAPISNGDPCPDLKECLHLDDALKALESSKAERSVIVPAAPMLVVALVGLCAMFMPHRVDAQEPVAPAPVAAAAPAAPAAAPQVVVAPAQPAPQLAAPQSLFQQLNVDHLLLGLALGLLGWIYKDLNPHIKAWLGAVQADPSASAVAHTAATIGMALDDLAESAAGHILHDDALTTSALVSDAAKEAASDAVDGLTEGAEAAAGHYLGATGKQLVDYLAGLIKKKVADARAAGATASAAVASVAQAAVAIDVAAKKA